MKSTIASLLGSAALVAAHGIVDNGLIGGENYTFYQPYQDPYRSPAPDRISRPIQGNGPVEDLTSIDIQCGGYTAGGVKGSSPAKLVAKAKAGEEVTLNWTLWPESHVGPVITYMAKCPAAGCSSWEPGTEKVWFKVQEGGREGTSNTWAATPLMKAGNSGVKYTIPSCIAPGQYLVRHEIIALHAAYSYPGAQFYPGCHQLDVSGSGSTSPSNLVAFPGAYAAADPGITYDPYKAQEYVIPGPALFSCSGSGSGAAPAPAPASSKAPVSTAAATSTRAAAAATTAPAAPVATPTQPTEEEEEEDCPAETASATVTAAASTPTQAADEEEEDCPAEEPETPTTTAAPVATPTQAADEEEDDCPAETEAPTTTAPAAPVATPTQPAEEEEEEDCPAESEAPVATPAPTQAADEEEEEDCPAETATPTAVAKRMSIHDRRMI